MRRKWTKENVFTESRKYESELEFQRRKSRAFNVAKENGWLKENTQKMSEMGENEAKNPIDGGKPTSETDIDGGKLTSKPNFPTLLIKNVYELLKMNRKIKYSQMEDNLGVDENTIWRAIAWLKGNGYINPERSKVKGEWQLL